MATKEKLLVLLERSRGAYISGENIAQSLNISRTAVWKSIKQLKDDGYEIDSITNKGYALSFNNDILSQVGICKHINPEYPLYFEVHRTISSTNEVMREHTDMPEGYVIAAGAQTEGKGRFGRSFFSPTETGVYFSMLLKPNIAANEVVRITTTAAVAVCRAIRSVSGQSPKIKWVNDIYLDGKKICGILTQASFSIEENKAEYVIVGIGLNVYRPADGFPEEIKNLAGALADSFQGDLKNRIVAEICNELFNLYKHEKYHTIAAEYKSHSFLIGKNVAVVTSRGETPAKVLDIDENCNLVVEYENGKTEVISSGEISIKNWRNDHEN